MFNQITSIYHGVRVFFLRQRLHPCVLSTVPHALATSVLRLFTFCLSSRDFSLTASILALFVAISDKRPLHAVLSLWLDNSNIIWEKEYGHMASRFYLISFPCAFSSIPNSFSYSPRKASIDLHINSSALDS